MPELPEVETVSRQLQGKICASRIVSFKVYDDKLDGIKNLRGKRVVSVERRGKTVCILLDNGDSVLIHLRMTGRLLWTDDTEKPEHGRLRITFENGNVFLVDTRRFATVKIIKELEDDSVRDIFKKFDLNDFIKNCSTRKVNVKTLIMDQRFIAGIGNIYACEILFRAGIHPERMAQTLTGNDWKNIFRNAREILTVAIKKRGTSVSDWWDLYGCRGENQFELKVYKQEGKKCSSCKGVIVRKKQNGRSTFYCPVCQK